MRPGPIVLKKLMLIWGNITCFVIRKNDTSIPICDHLSEYIRSIYMPRRAVAGHAVRFPYSPKRQQRHTAMARDADITKIVPAI